MRTFFGVNKAILFSVTLVFTSATGVSAQYLQQVWQHVELGKDIGGAGIWCGRLTSASDSDVIVAGTGGSPNTFFAVFKKVNSDYQPVWVSKRYDSDPIDLIKVANTGGKGVDSIYVILQSGNVDVYAGNTMKLVRTVSTQATNVKAAAFGDLYDNDSLDIAMLGDNYLKIFNVQTFSTEWDTTISNANDVKIGDVDGDGKEEIVLGNGVVLDGKTHAVKWSYSAGFGNELQLSDIDGDSIPEIIGAGGQYVTAFSASKQSPLWQINTGGSNVSTVQVADLNGDGNYEVIAGLDQWGGINVYSTTTRSLLWQLANPQDGITNMAIGDPDGDGTADIICGIGPQGTANQQLIVINSAQHKIAWQSLDLQGPYLVTSADIDGDGFQDIVGASTRSNEGYSGGNILAFNGVNDGAEWASGPIAANSAVGCIAAGNVTVDGPDEIAAGVGDNVVVYDAKTQRQLWEGQVPGTVTAIGLEDVNGDGVEDIVAGDNSGYVTVYNGKTFVQEWQSINMGSPIKALGFLKENRYSGTDIVFVVNNEVQVYNGSTHLLEWQITIPDTPTSMNIGDLYQNGIKEILLGNTDGKLSIINCATHLLDTTVTITSQSINSVLIANLDSTPGNEILAGTDTLLVLDPATFAVKWKSTFLGTGVGSHGSLCAADLRKDGHMDVLFGTSWGMFELRSQTAYQDITPPYPASYSPPAGFQDVGTNALVTVKFSEPITPTTLSQNTVILTSARGDTIPTLLTYTETTSTLQCTPKSTLPAHDTISVRLKGSITDTAGNGLDGNGNGISDGTPTDDFLWSFVTGTGSDTGGPNISGLTFSNDTVWSGVPIGVNAVASDSTDTLVGNVTRVECFIDSAGTPGSGILLMPAGGRYNLPTVRVSLTMLTDSMKAGAHTLLIHAKDMYNNWGKYIKHSFYVLVETPASWPMFGQNPQHTGFLAADSISAPLQLEWSKNLGIGGLKPVAVANNWIFATGNSMLEAVNAQTGAALWQYSFGQPHSLNPPSFAYGRVYVQREDENSGSWLYAFDALTGDTLWRSVFGAQWESYLAPTISGGKVFIDGGMYGGMYAYDALTGKQLWFKSLNQYDEWTPAVHNDTAFAFVGGSPSVLTAVDARYGSVIWQKSDIPFDWSGYSMFTAPVIDTTVGLIFTTSRDYLDAIDLNSQKIIWQQTGADAFNITPAIAYGSVFAIDSGSLVAYNELNGKREWSFTVGNLSSPPVVSNHYVFVASDSDTYAINVNNHESAWTFTAGGNITVANNHLYIAGSSGILYAFKRALTGVVQGKNDLPTAFQLYQNYPNPFNPSTTIDFDIPKVSHVTLILYDILGRRVETLVDENKSPGQYQVTLNASRLASGVYFYRLQAGSYSRTMKLLLLK